MYVKINLGDLKKIFMPKTNDQNLSGVGLGISIF